MWQLVTAAVDAAARAKATRDTNRANLEAIRLTNEGQMKLAEYQYEKNLEQWHRENAYNDPSSQMQRLANAGLNPHLVYEKGSAVQPSAASPQYDAPNLQAYHQDASPWQDVGAAIRQGYNDYIDTYLRQEMQKEEINHLAWQNDLLLEQAETERRRQGFITLQKLEKNQDVRSKRIYNEYYRKLLDEQLNSSKTNRQYVAGQTKKLDDEVAAIRAKIEVDEATVNLTKAQQAQIASFIEKNKAEIAKIQQDIAIGKEQAALIRAQTLLTKAQAKWTDSYGPGKNWIDSLQNLVYQGPVNFMRGMFYFANKVGVTIADAIRQPGTNNKINMDSPVTIGLKGFTTLAPGPAGSVSGFRLR